MVTALAVLFGTSRTTAYRTVHSIGELLDQHGARILPATTPPAALKTLHAQVAAHGDKTAANIKTTS